MASGADVSLRGDMEDLVRAVGRVTETTLERFAVVGGFAVAVRLGQAYRATTDVDMVYDEVAQPDAVAILVREGEARADDVNDGRVWLGQTGVEVMGVEPVDESDLTNVTELDALFVLSHSWALETATQLTIAAGVVPVVEATAPFATPAALLATKLHAIQARRESQRAKRSSDARDIHRLLLVLDADGSIGLALRAAPDGLRTAVRHAVHRVLVADVARTRSWLASDPDAGTVTAEELRFLGQTLLEVLDA
jgi:hypothetical protein